MVEWLTEPLQYQFFIRSLAAGIIVAVTCGVLSSFIVWRGMAFIGDALAHSILPGIVVALMLGMNIFLGALIAAVLSVFAIGGITNKRGLKEDTAIGVIFSGAFALGIILLNKFASQKDVTHILFGQILGTSLTDIIIISIIAVAAVSLIILFFKELLVTSFDPTHAIAIGLSPTLIHYGLLILIAAATVTATQTVGVVLVLALLVTPAAAASLIVKDLKRIIKVSVSLSVLSVIIGLFCSYHLELAPGGTIVLVLTLFFVITFIISKTRRK